MSFSSSYISDQELKDEQSYEGDEDDYIDEVKNYPRKCNYNNKSMFMSNISMLSSNDENKVNPNVTIFIRVLSDGSHVVDCFLYSELKEIITNKAPVFLWEGGNFGKTLEDFPVYLMPFKETTDQEIWFEGNYGLLSRYSAFLIYGAKQMKIGSNFASASRHGDLEYVWKVRPISKIQYVNSGVITENASVFSDRFDFAPGNYPGYDVSVTMFDIDDVSNKVCTEEQTFVECPVVNFFYRHGGTAIGFSTSIDTDELVIQTKIVYEKEYGGEDDDSFLYTGKKFIYITEYLEEVLCRLSSLVVEKLNPNDVSVTYTLDDQKMWRETIKSDGIIEPGNEKKESEEEVNSIGLEEERMEKFYKEEIDIIFDDKVRGDRVYSISLENVDSEIPIDTNIVVYNLPYFTGFKLSSPDDVPDLKKLVVYIKPHLSDDRYLSEVLTIPYYPNLEYLSIYTSDIYNGLVRFIPPPIEEVEHSNLKIVSLTNIKIDQENDQGLPVGLNIERLFIERIRSNLPESPYIFNMELSLDGDEDPETLYGTYPNLKFLSIDIRLPLPDFPKLCTLLWTGDEYSYPEHPNPRVKVIKSGNPADYKSFKSKICENEQSENEE